MPLIRVAEPFDHPDWIWELKHDGFRALAYVDHYECQLLSRRRHVYKQFRLRAIMPRPNVHARILYHDRVDGRGIALFDAVRGKDLEGVVAKWKHGR